MTATTIAALDPIVVVVFLLFGLAKWVGEKLKASGKAPPTAPPAAGPEATGEDDRMRRFLEALGSPAEKPKPIPPIVHKVRSPRPKRPAPPPLPAKRQPRSLDEEDAPTLPVEKIRLPDLVTSEVPLFTTVSSAISAEPAGFLSSLPPADEPRIFAPTLQSAGVLAALRSPRDLRTALVLCEILGPPRSLQR